MREERIPDKILVGKFHLEGLDVDRRTTLQYIRRETGGEDKD
jgi:hypothetical protein